LAIKGCNLESQRWHSRFIALLGLFCEDEAHRIAGNIAKPPVLLGVADHSDLDFPEGGG
jgi:hypothetical protein